MDAAQRRSAVADLLSQTEQPLSAASLASRFQVSRQIIVGDIALLRAGGMAISATPRGYIMPRELTGLVRSVACIHRPEDMGQELNLMVDNGCTVLDVVVEHPIYGQLVGQLQLHSRYDVQQFLEKVSGSDARPLADLTGGVHLHTLRCPSLDAYQRVLEQLEQHGLLYQAP